MQTLGEGVSELGGRRDVEDANIFDGDTNEVEINFNMLGALMLDGVGGEVDHTDVVVVDQGGPRWGALQPLKKLMEPARRWTQHSTLPHHSNKRKCSDASRIRRQG
jgi:hypothetical protein